MDRPRVILSAAMSLDGKIATAGGESKLSCEEDLVRVHELRAKSDVIMVGIGTVLQDNPKLTVRKVNGENPIRVIIDSEGRTPPDANVLDDSAKTIIAASERIDEKTRERFVSQNVEVIVEGDEKVNLKGLLGILKEKGVDSLVLEGGSTLNWGMLEKGLIDEVRVAICPYILGGTEAKTLVDGSGVDEVSDGFPLKLLKTERVGEDLLLVYSVGVCDD